VTGLIARKNDVESLTGSLRILIADGEKRIRFGAAAREWVEKEFESELVWHRHEQYLRQLLPGSSCQRGEQMTDLTPTSPGSGALRLAKRTLTTLGRKLPTSAMRALRLSVNYVQLGHWMRAHGFDASTRMIDRTAVFDSISEPLADKEVLYLEYGVYQGASLRYWSSALRNPSAQLHAFDSFLGLPETFDSLTHPMGLFDTGGSPPEIDDSRIVYHIGWFDQTVPVFEVPAHKQLVVTLDADLYSSTKLVLDHLRFHIKPGTILYFDDMSRLEHEPAAFSDYLQESGQVFEIAAVDETLNCAAFRCVK
jgi:hypothetical protein